jgi:Flp pilus assembly protein TadD
VTPEKDGGAPDPRPRLRPRPSTRPSTRPHTRPLPAWAAPVAIGAGLAIIAGAVFWFAYAGPIRWGLDASRTYYARGEYPKATAALDPVFARDENQVEGLLQLARIDAATGRSAEAIALYARVIDHWPNDAEVRYELALLERLLGNTAGAVPHLEAALKLEPGDVRYLTELAKAYVATGKPRDAAQLLLERADDEDRAGPERAAFYVQAGAALIEARADSEAKAALVKALKLAPKDPTATRLLEQLK